MPDVRLSWLLWPASRRPLGHIEVTLQGARISSVCVSRGELVGRSALTSDRAPGDVRLGRSLVGMMI
jgi:hypothetical protein